MDGRRWIPWTLLLLCSALPGDAARAQSPDPAQPAAPAFDDGRTDGGIVNVDGDHAYFYLLPGRAVPAGQTLEILRTVTARHPVTGAALVEYFPIGRMTIERTGQVLSVARIDRGVSRDVREGDAVRRPVAAAGIQPAPAITYEPPPNYVMPRESAPQGAPEFPQATWVAPELVRSLSIPRRLYEGDPLDVAVQLAYGLSVRGGQLGLRRAGTKTYRYVPLVAEGGGFLRARAPTDLLVAGKLELMVTLVDAAGRSREFGEADGAPIAIRIDPLPAAPKPPGSGHSEVQAMFEFVDFNRYRGNDYYLRAEADFMYRIGGPLYSVRTGFGILNGKGGRVTDLDAGAAPREVGLNYGYLEGELRLHRLFGMAARLLGGQTVTGPGVGAELRLRIGSELATNLVAGAAIVSDFGALGLLQLEWNVVKNWPMSVSVIVTNQPVQEDLGVRIVYQIGYRARGWIQPTLRVGYDARNLTHGGLSLGLGLVMGW